jgi:hypothetical protein
MKKIVSFNGVSGIGCTFADWSLHFLAGETEYFNSQQKQWLALPSNPLGKFNAHHHPKNHPLGLPACLDTLETFLDQGKGNLFSAYLSSGSRQDAVNALGIDDIESNYQLINDYHSRELAEIWQTYHDAGCYNVYITTDRRFPLRTLTTRSITDPTAPKDAYLAKTSDYYNKFFPQKNFDQLAIWDQRELLALDVKPFVEFDLLDRLDLSLPHCLIDGEEWLTQGERAMRKIMQYCQIDIDSNRLEQWLPVYYQWQKLQSEPASFALELEHIVLATVNGWYYPIELTFHQEAVVQHCLIYQYNLNIRNWELAKFPDNTQKLHKLLESNTHSITPY